MSTHTQEVPQSRAADLLNALGRALLAFDVKVVLYPIMGLVAFCIVWSITANRIDTSLGKFPGADVK